MLRRWVQVGVTLWWVTWVFFIVPCHTRGAISLDGSCAECSTPLFFGTLPSCCQRGKAPAGPKQAPDKKSPGNCAICQLAATTPHVPYSPGPLVMMRSEERVGVWVAVGAVYEPLRGAYQSRAPPAV